MGITQGRMAETRYVAINRSLWGMKARRDKLAVLITDCGQTYSLSARARGSAPCRPPRDGVCRSWVCASRCWTRGMRRRSLTCWRRREACWRLRRRWCLSGLDCRYRGGFATEIPEMDEKEEGWWSGRRCCGLLSLGLSFVSPCSRCMAGYHAHANNPYDEEMQNLKGGLACIVKESLIKTTENWTRLGGRATNSFVRQVEEPSRSTSEQGQMRFEITVLV